MSTMHHPQPIRILHLEDSDLDHQLVIRKLQQSALNFELSRVETLDAVRDATAEDAMDLILADYHLPGFTAIDAWNSLSESARRKPFILLSGAIGESAAVEAIKLGLSDYVLKDDLNRLPFSITRALEVAAAHEDKRRADLELAASQKRLAHFAEHLQATIEQERAAIAREIHDDIGGSLAAIRFDLSWLQRHATSDAALQHVQSAHEMLQHAIGASQRIMMNLRPAILDQGLEAAIQWLVASFEKRTHIKTTMHADKIRLNLEKNVELTAYRTAQEALTNISKYAQCSLVTVELADSGNVLTLEISDNGCGISPAQLENPRAFGLKGLQERAKTANGWLDISSKPGAGTSIILSIPLHDGASTVRESSFL